MGQVNIYIPDETKKRLKKAAQRSGFSISKLVALALEKYLCEAWPPSYFDQFGAIADDTFCAPEELELGSDVVREKL